MLFFPGVLIVFEKRGAESSRRGKLWGKKKKTEGSLKRMIVFLGGEKGRAKFYLVCKKERAVRRFLFEMRKEMIMPKALLW